MLFGRLQPSLELVTLADDLLKLCLHRLRLCMEPGDLLLKLRNRLGVALREGLMSTDMRKTADDLAMYFKDCV